ncbi:MAG: hypothetical protein JWN38_582 [Candidatus Saccharibacteria bacterium]|nr:hypothetical protein [Candidatus Saccharibacteria bacterium]
MTDINPINPETLFDRTIGRPHAEPAAEPAPAAVAAPKPPRTGHRVAAEEKPSHGRRNAAAVLVAVLAVAGANRAGMIPGPLHHDSAALKQPVATAPGLPSAKPAPTVAQGPCDGPAMKVIERSAVNGKSAELNKRYYQLRVKTNGETAAQLATKFFPYSKVGMQSIALANATNQLKDGVASILISSPEHATLQIGQSLQEFASKNAVDTNALVCMNGLGATNPSKAQTDIILPRQAMVPHGDTEVVAGAGDSYFKIAQANSLKAADLQRPDLNLVNAEELGVGEIIILPAGAHPAAVPTPVTPTPSAVAHP